MLQQLPCSDSAAHRAVMCEFSITGVKLSAVFMQTVSLTLAFCRAQVNGAPRSREKHLP